MIRALVIKELRESLPLVVFGALGIAYILTSVTGSSGGSGVTYLGFVPFVSDMLPLLMVPVCGVLAVLLGLKQSAWEEFRGTYHYLLHRPVARSRVIALKLWVGAAIVVGAAATLILAYAWWASTPGKHASPFYWSMTVPAWQVLAVLPVAYLSAFLSGLRLAVWHGTRLAPLAAGASLASLLAIQPFWWLTVVGSVVLCALLTLCIQHVAATRDY